MYGRKGPKVCNMNVLSEPVVVTGRAMAFAALEIVLNKFILQIRERNKDLKQCLARESTGQDEYVDAEEKCIMSCEPDGDSSTHETHTQPAEDYQPRGIHALISVLGHKAQLSAQISLLDLENCFLHERIQSRQLVLQVNQLQERTGRTIHELEHDPTVIGSMKHSGLVNISERLLKTSTNEEQKQYFLRWNDSLRQTITDLDQCESNGFKWQNFDLWAKRFELQVKLHSYETLSDTLRNTIHLPFVVMENKYLTEVANGRILTLKVQWLKERML
jgi:hypothetical protein